MGHRKPKDGPPPTFLCRNRAEVTRALAAVREHLGISQLELDEVAGFATGYTGKLERPDAPSVPGKQKTGRSVFHPMFDCWLGALGVGVMVVPLDTDADLAAARLPHVAPPRMTVKRAEKIRALHAAGRSPNTLWRMFRCTPQMVDDILAGRAYVSGRGRSNKVSA